MPIGTHAPALTRSRVTPLTIDRGRRDALVELMMYRIIVVGDQHLDRDRNGGISDKLIALQFGDDGALMVDLGWLDRRWLTRLDLPEARKEHFEIRVAHERLRGTLERTLDDAVALDAAAIGFRPTSRLPPTRGQHYPCRYATARRGRSY